MSYCRWSSMDWECDLYIYDSVGDFVSINVAMRRRKFDDTWPRMPKDATIEERVAIWSAQHEWMETHEDSQDWIDLNTIAPEFSGENYRITDPAEVADLLTRMRAAGLKFPDGIIEQFLEQAKEAGDG